MEQASENSPPAVTVQCPPGGRLHFAWGVGSTLRVIGVPNPASVSDHQSAEASLSTVTWGTATQAQADVAYEIASAHSELQQARMQEGAAVAQLGPEFLQRILDYSHTVRGKLHPKDRDLSQDGNVLLASEHALWQLMEVFCIHVTRSDGFIAEDMVCWLADNRALAGRLLSPSSLEERVDEVANRLRPDTYVDFWPCVRNLVAVGQLEGAMALLDRHDAMRKDPQGGAPLPEMTSQHEMVDALVFLLRSRPRFSLAGGQDPAGGKAYSVMPHFIADLTQWKALCAAMPVTFAELVHDCRTSSARTADGVLSVLPILAGEAVALSACTTSWMELLAATLFHQSPHLKARLLGALLERCVASKPHHRQDALPELLYHLLLALSTLELQRVVELLSCSGLATPWFMVHAYDLLRAVPGMGAALERPLDLFGGDQIEYWRLSLAESVAAQPSRWQLAVEYLAWCPAHGAAAVELLLEALPVASASDERQLLKALHCAERHGLPAAAAALRRRAAAAAWYGGRPGAAATHLALARDEARLAVVLGPIEAQVEDVLLSNLGHYEASALSLADAPQLQALLVSLLPPHARSSPEGSSHYGGGGQGSGSGRQSGAPAPARQQQPRHTTVAWLLDFLELQSAAEHFAAARDAAGQGTAHSAGASPSPALCAAHTQFQSSLMAAVRGGTVPPHLAVPLLFSAVPILESADGLTFGLNDIQALLACVATSEKVGLLGAAPLSVAAPDARHVRDVRLALARSLARAHVYQHTAAAVGGLA